MLGISGSEWLVILIVAVVLLRPADLPVILQFIWRVSNYVRQLHRNISEWVRHYVPPPR